VTEITTGGIEVSIADGALKGFIRKADLARDRGDQRPERFAVGDKVDALVTAFDKAGRKVSLSIKAMEIKDEKEAVEQYGSADSGASLGDILGAALASSGSKAKAPKAAPAAKGDAKSLDARGRLTAAQGDADDLKKIKGVGPAFEKKLHEAGIFHFWQIAALSDEQVHSLEEELAFQGRMERDDWKGQAEELMSEG
jgi:small subunit ribosomal protein S1